MKVRQMFWVLAIVGSIIGGIDFLLGLAQATSAPQQAAGTGIALCWAVLPYVFARAADEMVRLAAQPPVPTRLPWL
jgi:sugar phosphate permease